MYFLAGIMNFIPTNRVEDTWCVQWIVAASTLQYFDRDLRVKYRVRPNR